MQELIELIRVLLKGMFTGKIILHCHDGIIKKVTKEDLVKKF